MENPFRKSTINTRWKDDTILYQGIRLTCKNDQEYCDPTTRTQATFVWFPENTCTTFQITKTHARTIKLHQNYNDENSNIPVTFHKNGNVGGKLCPRDKGSTRLHELSLLNNTSHSAIHYEFHLEI